MGAPMLAESGRDSMSFLQRQPPVLLGTAGRFRHGTSFLRWRPDKTPRQCTMQQIERTGGADVRFLDRA